MATETVKDVLDATVETVVKAVRRQQTKQEEREFLFFMLMELSTSFPGTVFADAVDDMEKYWEEQSIVNGTELRQGLEFCAKRLAVLLKDKTIDINNIGDIINEELVPAVVAIDSKRNSKREVLAELLKTLAVYHTGDFGLAVWSATKHLGAIEADLEIGPE